ncbi:MAG: class I SAM-dependent methyltransferase [Candidatus Woesearchaeota archaeon]
MKTAEQILKKVKATELLYGKNKELEKIRKIITKTKKEEEIFHKRFFWDYESSRWDIAINKEIRNFIKQQLKVKGRILDFGAGSFCYIKKSIACDLSFLMLKKNKVKLKVLYHFHDKPLPFRDKSFDNVLLIFVVDYIDNVDLLLREIKRILKKDGKVVVVQSKTQGIYNKIKQKQITKQQLEKIMQKHFKVISFTKKFQKKSFDFIVGEKV